MENSEDKLLKDFFRKNKAEFQDVGFAVSVMKKFHMKERTTDWIVPVFTLAGIIISMLMVDIREMIFRVFELVAGIPFIYMMAGFMLFPIVFLFLYFFCEKERAY